MNKDLLEQYKIACDYPGILDVHEIEKQLGLYLTALDVKRKIVRLERGWTLDQHASLKKYVNSVLVEFKKRNPQDARAARDARDARDARAAQAALHNFASWCMQSYGWWWRFELSWIVTTYLGAIQTQNNDVEKWSAPLFQAFLSGAWILHWTENTLYWVTKPTIYTEIIDGRKRLHHQTGPALVSDIEDLYFWHGVLVPSEWIRDKSLTAKKALGQNNIELRRVACEILGWTKILDELHAKEIDRNPNPQIGTLYEVDLPDAPKERFLRVLCGTEREFAINVDQKCKTALEAQCWMWQDNDYQPEVRT